MNRLSTKIRGVTVTFLLKTQVNEFGEPTGEPVEVPIDDVLFAPATSAALTSASGASLVKQGRTYATQSKATLYLPKGATERLLEVAGTYRLMNQHAVVPISGTDDAIDFAILSDPLPLDQDICPTRWNWVVMLRDIEG